MFSTPGGSPASVRICASASIDSGVSAAGLTMIVQPAATAGPILRVPIAVGKFHGVMNRHGPTACFRMSNRPLPPGSTEVGRRLIAAAAPQVLRVSMELGGNAPFLVFEDADLDAAVDGAVLAKMRNIGEACTAANRLHVHQSVADEFAARLAERLGAMRVGRGTEADVQVGPLVEEKQRQKVVELVDDARERGAKALVGGEALDGPGYFYAPTVLRDVPSDARVLREEIFGPVAPIATFMSDDEALRAANDTEFGLVSYAYTRDLDRAFRVIEGLETGMVGLNRGLVSNPAGPFGGVKQSGFGREGGHEGIDEYLEVKYVAAQIGG